VFFLALRVRLQTIAYTYVFIGTKRKVLYQIILKYQISTSISSLILNEKKYSKNSPNRDYSRLIPKLFENLLILNLYIYIYIYICYSTTRSTDDLCAINCFAVFKVQMVNPTSQNIFHMKKLDAAVF
jgi:hypothetical protein